MTQAKRPPPQPRTLGLPRTASASSEAATEQHPQVGLSRFAFIDKRYALELLLGRGGMGEVWSAYDRKLGQRVAIKLVPFEGAAIDDAPARLAREYAITRRLVSPAFAEVYAQGTHDGSGVKRAYLVMELLDGETLQARLERQGRLTMSEARDCLRGIAVALRTAHALRVVHRDLKPSNVFFARPKASSGVRALDGRKEVVKLLDFGIAMESGTSEPVSGERLTRPGMLVGSSQYMSPEQIGAHKEVDTRSDLWSLGVLLFRAITGERPFKGTSGDVFARILQDPPPRVTVIDRSLPRGLDTFFRRALEKHPTMRYQTVDEMLEGFEEALRSTARTPSGPFELDITWDEGEVARANDAERPTRADLQRVTVDDVEVQRASWAAGAIEVVVDIPALASRPAPSRPAPAPSRPLARAPSSPPASRTIRTLSITVVLLVAAVVVLVTLFLRR